MSVLGAVVSTVLVVASAPASAALPGYRVVTTSSGSDATDFKTAPDAVCPVGKKLIGTGYSTSTTAGNEIAVDEVIPLGSPDAAPTAARVGAAESDATTGRNWSVSASAICSDPLPGLQRVLANSPFDSAHTKSATARCPAGKKLTGTGFSINGSAGEIVIDRILPSSNLSEVAVYAKETDLLAASWSVQAFAVCADPLPGLELVYQEGTAFDSTQSKSETARCPAGKALTGSGYVLTALANLGGQVVVDSVRPATLGGSVVVHAAEEDPLDAAWKVDPIAICALL